MDVISYLIGRQSGKTPLQEKTLDITANGTTQALPDAGFALSKVIVNTNVAGGAKLNIAYGDTAPEDTSKLWVKTNEPDKVLVTGKLPYIETAGASIEVSTALPSTQQSSGAIGAIDNKIYILGGASKVGTSNGKTTDVITVFDIDTKTFSVLPVTMPTPITACGYATVGKKIFTFGGRKRWGGTVDYLKTIVCFDAETQTVSTVGNLAQSGYDYKVGAIGSNVYIFGVRNYMENLYCFNTETNTVELLDFSFGSISGVVFSNGQDIFVAGGTIGGISTKGIAKLNFDTNDFTTVAQTKFIAYKFASFIDENKLCGLSVIYNNTYYTTVDISSGESLTYKESDINGTNNYHTYADVVGHNGKLYIFFGYATYSMDGDRVNNTYIFSSTELAIMLSDNELLLFTSNEGAIVTIVESDVNKITVYIKKVYKGIDGEAREVEAAIYKDGAWTPI